MNLYKLTLRPQSAFITPLKGDTLFGQLCWQIRESFGEARLTELLSGYTANTPFAVVSDAFIQGTLPMPNVPMHLKTGASQQGQLKKLKKIKFINVEALHLPVKNWLSNAKTLESNGLPQSFQGLHNSINRLTNSTTGDAFSPFTLNKYSYPNNSLLDCYLVLDTTKLDLEEAKEIIATIGLIGYGRKANTGHGKFSLESIEKIEPSTYANPNGQSYLTLAPCRVAPEGWNTPQCYYQLFTRFGRHGIQLVHTQPFKQPVMLMETGAVLTPQKMDADTLFIGQGLTGISQAQPQAVQQAYSPVLRIDLGTQPNND